MISVRYNDGHWEVWTDCFEGEFNGRCIGSAELKTDAFKQAHAELWTDLSVMQSLTNQESLTGN